MKYQEALRWHEAIFRVIAYRQRPKCFLELGLGETPVLTAIAPYCAEMHGVDPGGAPFDVPKNATVYKMTTNEFFEGPGILITPPDLVFVDADHDSAQVLKDLDNVAVIAADNCLVLLHDTFPQDKAHTLPSHCSDSYRVPGMISWEHVTLPFPPGLTLLRMNPKGPL